jgi:hypothetical protein
MHLFKGPCLELLLQGFEAKSPQLPECYPECFQALMKLKEKGFGLAHLAALGPGGIGELPCQTRRNATIRMLRSLNAACTDLEAAMRVSCEAQSCLHQRAASLRGTMHMLMLWVGSKHSLRHPTQMQQKQACGGKPAMRNVGAYEALIRIQDRL